MLLRAPRAGPVGTKVVEFDIQIFSKLSVGSNFLVEQDAEVAAFADDAVEFVIRMMTMHVAAAAFVNPNPGFEAVIFTSMTDGPAKMSLDERVTIQVELNWFERCGTRHRSLLWERDS